MMKWIFGALAVGASALAALVWVAPDVVAQVIAQVPRPAPHSSQQAPTAAPAPAAPAAATPPSAPVRIETVVYDSWTVTCRDTVERASKKTCSAQLQVVERERNQVLFVWVIGRSPEGQLLTVLQTPTGVQIGKGVDLKIGEAPARKLAYAVCEPQRCQATVEMDAALVRDLTAAAGANTTATIHAVDGRAINFNMPIKGIDKALSAVGR